MKVKVKNLGSLKQAEFELGELTVICGGNNTGKTYATYALFGFLDNWRDLLDISINHEIIDKLLSDGVVDIDLKTFSDNSVKILEEACKQYTKSLPKVFASNIDKFKDSFFNITLNENYKTVSFERKLGAQNKEIFSIIKEEGDNKLIVSLLVERNKVAFPNVMINDIIKVAIGDILFQNYFPKAFIASAERTGAAIFRQELNFARNKILKEVSQKKNLDPFALLSKNYQEYASPVESNVDFTRNLEKVAQKQSYILKQHPDILDDFSDIIGGNYSVTKNDELYFRPKSQKVKLTMDESSSSVRSLLDVGFYMRHVAKKGDLLIIDEPELNLHPENQRLIARLFVRLINIGIKVFITTHSDYIVKELNTLIMLNRKTEHLIKVSEEEGYREDELLSVDKVRVYIAEKASIKLDGNSRKSVCQTLTEAKIESDYGINAHSFDKTIDDINRIQDAIIWGD